MPTIARLALIGAACPLLALAACNDRGSTANSTEALDSALVNGARANETDPALTAALEDQIMVDPTLSAQANSHSVRPPDTPPQAPIPPATEPGGEPSAVDRRGIVPAPAPTPARITNGTTLGELARAQLHGGATGRNCVENLRYSMAWADRLPAGIPLYPGARVSEAAGNDTAGCETRIVSARVTAPVKPLIDWYYTRLIRAGYSSEHQIRDGDHVLAGTKGDAAYYITFGAGDADGIELDIIANHGR